MNICELCKSEYNQILPHGYCNGCRKALNAQRNPHKNAADVVIPFIEKYADKEFKYKGKDITVHETRGENCKCSDCPVLYGMDCPTSNQ